MRSLIIFAAFLAIASAIAPPKDSTEAYNRLAQLYRGELLALHMTDLPGDSFPCLNIDPIETYYLLENGLTVGSGLNPFNAVGLFQNVSNWMKKNGKIIECFNNATDHNIWLKRMGLEGVDPIQFFSMLTSKMLFNLFEGVKVLQGMKQDWDAGKFNQSGFTFGLYLNKLFPQAKQQPRRLLAQLTNEQAAVALETLTKSFSLRLGLKIESFDSLRCYKGQEADWMNFDAQVLEKAKNLNPFNSLGFASLIRDRFLNMPKDQLDCLLSSPDVIAIGQRLNMYGSDEKTITTRGVKNLMGHIGQYFTDVKAVQNAFNEGNYELAGTLAAPFAEYMFSN